MDQVLQDTEEIKFQEQQWHDNGYMRDNAHIFQRYILNHIKSEMTQRLLSF